MPCKDLGCGPYVRQLWREAQSLGEGVPESVEDEGACESSLRSSA